jgi:hypothetical protein
MILRRQRSFRKDEPVVRKIVSAMVVLIAEDIAACGAVQRPEPHHGTPLRTVYVLELHVQLPVKQVHFTTQSM